MDFLIVFSKGISSVTTGWLLRWMGNWESWKMFKRLNGQERCWIWGFCSENSTKCLREVYILPEILFFLFVTTSVVFICKFAVKVVCGSTGGKSAAMVLTSDGTEGLQEEE